jgi:phospholipase/lecithinase/hemolysin
VKTLRNFAGALVLATAALGTSPTAQPKVAYHAFFVFGDSVADNGNDFLATTAAGIDPAIPPSVSPHRTYSHGRFSNGLIAFEYLWARIQQGPPSVLTPLLADRSQTFVLAPCPTLPFTQPPDPPKKGAVDFAFGGASSGDCTPTSYGLSVPGLKTQVRWFGLMLGDRSVPKKSLFAMVVGANDYQTGVPPDPQVVVNNITDSVKELYRLGAHDVMVLNLPDLGNLPLSAPLTAAERAVLNALTLVHNTLLQQSLSALASTLPDDSRLILINLHDFVAGLSVNPNFTFAPALPFPASFCLFTDPTTCPDVPTFNIDPRYVFWDAEHPTTATHYLLSQYFFDALQDAP